jgi:hypothetical protein
MIVTRIIYVCSTLMCIQVQLCRRESEHPDDCSSACGRYDTFFKLVNLSVGDGAVDIGSKQNRSMRLTINCTQSCIAGGNRRQDGRFIRLNTIVIEVASRIELANKSAGFHSAGAWLRARVGSGARFLSVESENWQHVPGWRRYATNPGKGKGSPKRS